MPHLRRVHFASVGYPDARLAPLTLDLRDAEQRTATDSVLWLRNGGGKSSVLNLLFSVFRTNQSDFLGRHVEGQRRRLTDYVKASDLACVVTEWEMGEPDLLGTAPLRVVGQLLAWRGQQRSADASRLARVFFSFWADDGCGFDHLPTPGLAAPVESLEAFRDWLREQGRENPARELVVEDQQRRWERHLTDLRLDPELFGYQLKMNRREGAADELFKFASSRQFTDFVLELALDPTQANAVSANLEVLRDKLARRPQLRLERDFSLAAREALGPLLSANDQVAAAEANLQRWHARAASLMRGLQASAGALEGRVQHCVEALAALGEALRLVQNEQRKRARWAEGLERLSLELAVQEAEASVAAAQARLTEASGRLARAIACEPLRELRAIERRVAELQHQLGAQQAKAEPERRRLEAAGDQLRAALREQLAELSGRQDKISAELAQCESLADEARAAQRAAEREAAAAAERASYLRQQLQQRDEERERLLARGDLLPREDADAALARLSAERARVEQSGREHAERLTRAREAQRRLAERISEQTALLSRQRERAQQAQARLAEALAWRERIETQATITDFEECERADALAAGLVQRLSGAAQAAEDVRLRLRVDDAEDARADESLRERGLLPAALDVERVARRLREAGIVAHSGWEYLADNVASEAEKRALLQRDPSRFGGVMVDPDLLPRALAVSGLGRGLRGSVELSAAALRCEAEARHVLGPDGSGGFDHGAAVGAREQLLARREKRGREIEAAHVRAAALREAASEVQRFVAAWGGGRLLEAQEGADALSVEVEQLVERCAALAAERDAEADAERDAAQALSALRDQERELGERLARLSAFIERWESKLEALRRDLDAAREQVTQQQQAARAWGERELVQRTRRDGLREQQAETRRLEKEGQLEHDGVRYHGDVKDAPVPQAGSLAELRAQYDSQRRHFEEQYGDEHLRGALSAHVETRRGAEQRFLRASRGLRREDIEAFDGLAGERLDVLLREAQDHERAAREQLAGESHALGEARRQLGKHSERRREAADLPPGPPPDTAQAARDQAAAQREAAQESLERARDLEEQTRAMQAEQDRTERARERRLAQARRVGDACQPGEGPALALPSEEAALSQWVDECIASHRAAREALTCAREAQRRALEALRQVPLRAEYAGFDSAWRQRLMDTDEAVLESASRWHGGLAERIGALEDELASLEADRETLVQSLLGITEQAVRLLLDLERASRMPGELRGWANQPFVSVHMDLPETDQDKRTRLESLLDELVQAGHMPGGLELVQRAVDKYRGSKPLRVTILKPEAERRRQRVDIAAMVNFSGGERLTAAVLLYCTLVHLRARRRGQRGAPSGNVLVLDNPIGTCSSVGLLELQREVARAMDTQLIYTTGVDDLAALAQLPNVVRLRNMHRSSRTGDQHVTLEGQVESVRVVRREAG